GTDAEGYRAHHGGGRRDQREPDSRGDADTRRGGPQGGRPWQDDPERGQPADRRGRATAAAIGLAQLHLGTAASFARGEVAFDLGIAVPLAADDPCGQYAGDVL